jgi:gamma-glutamyltranspeptidase / glutathione hydrolase
MQVLRPAMLFLLVGLSTAFAQVEGKGTHRPPLHARHWMALTGKPLAATAGAKTFERGGNAIDAACAMLAAACTMHDMVGWGGETQALIYNPKTKKVIGVNGLGVAPTGATPEFFRAQGLRFPPEEGPLAAVTPGTPGALLVMLAEFGQLSLAEVLAPALELAEGYPIEAYLVRQIQKEWDKLMQWPYSRELFFPHTNRRQPMPRAGELFRQRDLRETLQKLIAAERIALESGKDRKAAIMAAYDRFYKGDIGAEYARASQEQGGLITRADLAKWSVKLEEPVSTTYKGIEVFKLTSWTQGPALLQTLNILEEIELAPMGYNSARYIHTLYQAMNLAFADRDFYYGDPDFPPAQPLAGLLSKDYAKERRRLINWQRNNPRVQPGDPYRYQRGSNPFRDLLENWSSTANLKTTAQLPRESGAAAFAAGDTRMPPFFRGTTSIQAADKDGWLISITPSGGWMPMVVAGRTGMGMSQRMQSFVLDPAEGPFNVLEPGKRPRVTLTPTLAFKNRKPWLAFSVQGGDTQEQNLLQFLLNLVEFDLTIQEAAEAANFTSYQMRASFAEHEIEPGRLTLTEEVPSWVRKELEKMGYKLDFVPRNSGPITAIQLDHQHGTIWGAASNFGEDYGIGW